MRISIAPYAQSGPVPLTPTGCSMPLQIELQTLGTSVCRAGPALSNNKDTVRGPGKHDLEQPLRHAAIPRRRASG